MDYEKISDGELCRLLKEKVPDKTVPEVADYNRQTMVAFLKVFSKEADTPAPNNLRISLLQFLSIERIDIGRKRRDYG